MLQVTRIFHFEMAHAIHGYKGKCKNIHGHSYQLHVTVSSVNSTIAIIPSPGFIVDFKALKNLVNEHVIPHLDHGLVLSEKFLADNPGLSSQENLLIWETEPSAENLLVFIRQKISDKLPDTVKLAELTLYETKDSYAAWKTDTIENNK